MRFIKLTIVVLFLFWLSPMNLSAQSKNDHLAPKPVFSDHIYDGAADPSIIYNKKDKQYWMFYTNRRANDKNAVGVTITGRPPNIHTGRRASLRTRAYITCF